MLMLFLTPLILLPIFLLLPLNLNFGFFAFSVTNQIIILGISFFIFFGLFILVLSLSHTALVGVWKRFYPFVFTFMSNISPIIIDQVSSSGKTSIEWLYGLIPYTEPSRSYCEYFSQVCDVPLHTQGLLLFFGTAGAYMLVTRVLKLTLSASAPKDTPSVCGGGDCITDKTLTVLEKSSEVLEGGTQAVSKGAGLIDNSYTAIESTATALNSGIADTLLLVSNNTGGAISAIAQASATNLINITPPLYNVYLYMNIIVGGSASVLNGLFINSCGCITQHFSIESILHITQNLGDMPFFARFISGLVALTVILDLDTYVSMVRISPIANSLAQLYPGGLEFYFQAQTLIKGIFSTTSTYSAGEIISFYDQIYTMCMNGLAYVGGGVLKYSTPIAFGFKIISPSVICFSIAGFIKSIDKNFLLSPELFERLKIFCGSGFKFPLVNGHGVLLDTFNILWSEVRQAFVCTRIK